MSVRKLAVRFATRARRDYEDALLYTRRTWGADQHAKYRAAFARAFTELATYPLLGRARDDLLPGCRSPQVEQHVIYYLPRADELVVVRILHVRQEAEGAINLPPT